MTQAQCAIRIQALDHPDAAVLRILYAITPETLFNLSETPTAMTGAVHAAIEGQQQFSAPAIDPMVRWSKQPLQRSPFRRNWIGHIHPEADPHLTQP